MTPTIVHPLTVRARIEIERYEIHDATCRARRQNLACSTCSDLHERACRAFYAAEAVRLAEVA